MRVALVLACVVLAAGCSKLTPENYAKVKIGMPYSEVTTILGGPDSCSDTAGFKSCRWGDDKRNVTVRFAGEKVVVHTADNLR
jgi:outer membrane protein assembly factor BamE (lipoprotein component of BamABCDE complex)